MKRNGRESIESLLAQLLEGNANAWEELVREFSPLLLGLVRKTFAGYGVRFGAQEQEDAAAEVWKNLLENDCRVLRECQVKGNFLQTLYVLARNRAVDIMRRRRRTFDVSEFQIACRVEDEEAPGELASAILAVKELPDKQRVLVNLFFLQRKSYREITELTGIPQNSIGPTLARALARLRKVLEAQDAV